MKQKTSEFEVQTDPIMVPFPLPAIGKIDVPKTLVTECVCMQTEYTWVLNEFPTRVIASLLAETEKPVSPAIAEAEIKPQKKRGSPKKAPAKDISVKTTEAESSEQVETTDSGSDNQIAEAETQEVVAPAPSTPKKKASKKKQAEPATPATPATTVAPETPVADVLRTPPVKRTSSLLPPILSDSSDDETVLLNKSSPLKRTITPVTVKPTVSTPAAESVKPTKAAPQKKQIEAPSSDSESEVHSSSSDSDNEVPSASLITAGGKRKKETSSTSPRAARYGPFVQVNNLNDESAVDEIRKRILDKIPEPLRKGAVKEAVVDSSNKRVIFHLRSTPKVTHFLSTGGNTVKMDNQERPLVFLTELERKQAMELFKDTAAPAEHNTKRKRQN